MSRRHTVDDDGMEKPGDQPWMVLARRPTPLAGLLRADRERKRGKQSPIDCDGLDEAQNPLADLATTPEPPATGA
jgi:hypothetical protein